MSAAKRRGAQATRKSGPRRRLPKWLTVVRPECPAGFVLVKQQPHGFRVDVCGLDGDCIPIMNFRTGKEARIFAFTRAHRLNVEVRT